MMIIKGSNYGEMRKDNKNIKEHEQTKVGEQNPTSTLGNNDEPESRTLCRYR